MSLTEKYYKTKEEYPGLTLPEDIVFEILNELDGRKGLSGFEECDYETQEEILEKLVEIVDEKLGN